MSNYANDEDRFEDFLKRLSKLSRQTGVTIGGCGCCGSPYVSYRKLMRDDLRWDEKREKYTLD